VCVCVCACVRVRVFCVLGALRMRRMDECGAWANEEDAVKRRMDESGAWANEEDA
jgi:hypothetical protein